jgi:hypothetical protein
MAWFSKEFCGFFVVVNKICKRVLNLGRPIDIDTVVMGNIFAMVDDELITLIISKEVVNEDAFDVCLVFHNAEGPRFLSEGKMVNSLLAWNFCSRCRWCQGTFELALLFLN